MLDACRNTPPLAPHASFVSFGTGAEEGVCRAGPQRTWERMGCSARHDAMRAGTKRTALGPKHVGLLLSCQVDKEDEEWGGEGRRRAGIAEKDAGEREKREARRRTMGSDARTARQWRRLTLCKLYEGLRQHICKQTYTREARSPCAAFARFLSPSLSSLPARSVGDQCRVLDVNRQDGRKWVGPLCAGDRSYGRPPGSLGA